ncbi:MAG: hypothetical protein K2R93_01965 [Gemmatimonadaceae bacterium]|nr:hypothetical protein [Gemmatimonadaceae bacterium]
MLIARDSAICARRRAATSRLLGAALLMGCGGVGSSTTGPDAGSTACNKGTLTIGGSVTGNTGANRCRLGSDVGNIYELVVTQSSAVTLTMSGNAFPGFIGLYTSDGKYLAIRNDKDPSLTIPIVLGPGTYLLRIDSMTGADGPYTLSAPALVVTACNSGIALTKGATYTGALNVTSCFVPDGRKYQSFAVVSGTPATFSVTTTVDRRGTVNLVGTTLQDFGPGSFTGTLSTTTQGLTQMATLTVLSQSASAIPLTYTVKVD